MESHLNTKFLAKKRVLITGISGMVGSHLADFLFKNTKSIIFGMIRCRSPLENLEYLIPEINKNNKRINLVYGDLNDSISLDRVIKTVKPAYIFHLAAQSFPQISFYEPISTLNTNILGTARLLESIKKYAPNSVIHVCSSSEVFGKVPKENVPIDENCSFHPASPYAISKVGTDLLAKFYYEAYGLKVFTTRMFTHTGPRRGDVFAESTFAKQIALIENKMIEPIINVGNLNSLRTIADVRDAVRAYIMLVSKNNNAGQIYNIGGNYSCKIGDILKFLVSKSSMKKLIKIKIDKKRLRPIDADLQIPNTKKFQNHYNWKPDIGFEKTMSDLLEYWRDKIRNNKSIYLKR
jgi:GDP-mannose 4,6-dehydratase